MPEYKFFKDTTVKVYSTVKDEYGNIIPLSTVTHFSVQIKSPYADSSVSPLSTGITGPTVAYGSNTGPTGPSQFYFTYVANTLGTFKYKIQYNTATGPTGPIGPHMKAATVGSFRVVDDDF
jgi:hypothetical protein